MKLFELRIIADKIHFRALQRDESPPSDAPCVLSGLEGLREASDFSALVCSERYILPGLYVLCRGSPSDLPPQAEWLDYPSPFSPSALPADWEALRRTVMGFPTADALHRLVVSEAYFEFLPLIRPTEWLRESLRRVLWREHDLEPGALRDLSPKLLPTFRAIHEEAVKERKQFLAGLWFFVQNARKSPHGLLAVLGRIGLKSEDLGLETAFQARMVVLEIYRVPSGGATIRYVSPFDPRLNNWPGAEIRVAVVASFHEREAARLGYHVAPLVLVLPGYSYLPMGEIPVALWWHDQWVLKASQDKREGEGGRDRRKNRISRLVQDETEIYQFLLKALGLEEGR
jgi:hypothetical protein